MAKTPEEAVVSATTPDACCNFNDDEEFWPAPSLLTGHTIHNIRLGVNNGRSSNKPHRVLRYKSMPSEELTPLDMIYGKSNTTNTNNNTNDSDNQQHRDTNNNDDPFRDDEFYDGTGNLMWMAAICFGHLVAQEVEPLRSYLLHGSPTALNDDERSNQQQLLPKEKNESNIQRQRRRFCELGCGTGGAGISLLLCNSSEHNNNKHYSSDINNNSCHVVFTDNDAQSLELCASNCELNGLDPDCYSQQLLGWGSEYLESAQQHQQQKSQDGGGGAVGLESHSFDVVLATDVIYDLKMIAPLFETVDNLLKKKTKTTPLLAEQDNDREEGGHLVLSHVPRFCIPKDESDRGKTNGESTNNDNEDSPSEVFLELERFIRSEANKVGLVLAQTIRPHQVLSEEGLWMQGDCNDDDDDDSMQQLTLESMKEAHAVVFVFERS